MTIIIKNLSSNVTADSLAAVFSTYGKVSSCRLLSGTGLNNDSETAIIDMPDEKEFRTAIEQLNGCFVDGKVLLVETTEVRRKSPLRSYYKQVRTFLSPKEKHFSFLFKNVL